MRRLGILFWIALVVGSGLVTFRVKYAVQDLEDALSRVRRQTAAEQQEIRVLTAEWTYLNQPERLADLNRRFLGLAPITPKQLQTTIADIPLRVPQVTDTLVATVPEPPAQVAAALRSPAPPPVVAATFNATAKPPPVLQVARTSARTRSLDALVAQIAETH